ncbi:NAD(P)/FAD-dependent oxidoreductase [Patescibacteria group bacterium]|nr:NAD(P)/FAD-dependent oxidoreductase [Patescibacteria group bacterium]
MKHDLMVIGGGPAGMMAAGRAAENGARVLLLEKRGKLGVKLSITGKGRCNITNAEFDNRKLIKKYGSNGNFLFPPFHKFGPQEVINFFEKRNIKTKIERGNRVFPVSNKSSAVIEALIKYLKQNNVTIKTNATVKSIVCEDNKIKKVALQSGEEFMSDKYAICTGGQAYPQTGSTGDAYNWLEKMGHKIISPEQALVPVIVAERWVKELEGLSLKNVDISIYKKEKKVESEFGEAIFTDNGMSGPVIIEMSKKIGQLLKDGEVELQIDYKPALNFTELDQRIQKDFKKYSNKLFKNSLQALMPRLLIPVIINLSKINPDKKVNAITKKERKTLIHLLKSFKLQVKALAGFDRAIVTSGGVDLKEIDPRTMQSKIITNLYLAGEIINIDGPTGGYNLQICWSTGYCVGDNF